jgi:zinc protease
MKKYLTIFLLQFIIINAFSQEKKLWAKSFLNKKAPTIEVEGWITEKPKTEGKFILIDFWATWCGPCIKAIPELNLFSKKFKNDLVVIGLSDEPKEKIQKFKKEKIEYFSAYDTNRTLYNKFEVKGIPHVVLIDPNGIVKWEGYPFLGKHELTEEVIEKVILKFKNKQKEEEIPLDPNFRRGVLANGLTYYIRHNEEPKDRASFYMVQNVGSILEEDNQKGLAHFLEHMAFNGTKNYPEKGMLDYLESKGAKFGKDINAYTSFDETVYNISNIPVNNLKVLDSSLLVLHDWSNYLTLADAEIDAERGVINEEWRSRRNARKRMWDKQSDALFGDSKYSKRDVIGSMDIVQNFEYKALRDFYHKWYRTDLQAIVIVGDFDVNDVENRIKQLFSDIPIVKNAPKRKYYEVPNNDKPKFVLATDKEATSSSINIQYKKNIVLAKDKNTTYLRNLYVKKLYTSIVNNRLNERLQKENPPYMGAQVYFTSLYLTKDASGIYVAFKENEWQNALEEAYSIFENSRDYGVTQGELDRAKTSLLSGIENQYRKRAKKHNDSYAKKIKNHYLKNEPVPGIEYELNFIKNILPTISLEDVSAFSNFFFKEDNMLITVSGPEKENITYPTKEDILTIITKVKTAKTTPYVDTFKERALISNLPKSGTIIKTKLIPELDAKKLTLSNGIKVYTKHSILEKDKISFTGFSWGGTSQLEIEDIPNTMVFNNFIGSYGLGSFNSIELSKALTGKIVSVNANLGNLSETINGSSSTKNLETLFKLTHLHFAKPRFDKQAYNALYTRYKSYAKNLKNDVSRAFRDTIGQVMSNHNPRVKIFNEEILNNVSFNRIEEIYKERFLNPGDFFFVISGDFNELELKQHLEKYIASLSVKPQKETFIDHKVRPPSSNVTNHFKKDLETSKASVYVSFNDQMKYSQKNAIYLKVISSLLSKRFMIEIREKEGGTYGVRVQNSMKRIPYHGAGLTFSFECKPENANKLKSIALKEIEKLKNGAVNQEDLKEIKNNFFKERSEYTKKLNYWHGKLINYGKYNEFNMTDDKYQKFIKSINTKKIIKKTNRFFDDAVKTEVIMSSKK